MDTSPDNDATSAIMLERMPQQSEVVHPEDDWTGVISVTKRRRLQNRLNQRAYRRRKLERESAESRTSTEQSEQVHVVPGLVAQQDPGDQSQPLTRRGCRLEFSETRNELYQFARQAYQEYLLASPRPAALHTLIQLNVLNALGKNAAILGITIESLCQEDSLSPFNCQGPWGSWDSLPPALRPTTLQIAVRHHPWIDLFPLPQMRDNFLRALGSIDEEELNVDLVDVEEETPGGKPNLIVWGEPSDPGAWEATVPFLRKWGWVLRGCRETFDATNHWRETRGETRLVFETQ
ncbi:hypothetical protein NKR23_g8171 [Pleurostoma richardsiae]|uniref:BZIP domain-containing protein n=1 Tax=Pleurostoma richardsiae TaxID=41990 RepID=A0AA38RR74_9PEZI|nr:hypothetical protein NKR23_g8171 [Pleurostoma richardsiae]